MTEQRDQRIVHNPDLAAVLACLQAANAQLMHAAARLRDADQALRTQSKEAGK